MLKLAKTAKELKYLLNNRNIMVDGKRIMGKNFQIGLMDVLSIPDIGKNYRILLNRQNRIYAKEIDANESKYKLCKITGKTAVKGSRIQLNLHDAKSVITKDKVSVGDTLVFEFGKGVTGKLEYKEGALVYLTAGKHVGKFGKIVKTIETKRRRDWVVIRSNDTELTTAKRYAFVVGDDTPRISLD
jgi:small subunit ribosomal protein S4e